MPIVRKQLKPSDVYPTNLRYNETTGKVQSLINGDWVDNPDADPRDQTVFPARVTSDPPCDAAESVKDAFKGQIDGVLLAIEASQTVFTIAGIILSLLAFGPFGIFIALALTLGHDMLDAGTTAINAALTETAYHSFVCILRCQMDSTGRLKENRLGAINTAIDNEIGGLGAVILKGMVGLAGEGGMNNLAALGMSTGDCEDCDCEVCDLDPYDWNAIFLPLSPEPIVRDNDAGTITQIAVNSGAYWYACVSSDTTFCDLGFSDWVGSPPAAIPFQGWVDSTETVYTPSNESNPPWTPAITGWNCNCVKRAVMIRGTSPFTVIWQTGAG